MQTKLFINNQFIETAEKGKVINPSTGEVITEVSVASDREIEAAIVSARDAYERGPWRKLSFAQRKDFILKIAEGILAKAGDLANLETLNTGKPIKESTFMDIPSSAQAFQYIAGNFEKYLQEESPVLEQEARVRLIREQLGVAVLIVPWNYPLLIASWKLASALAAGNTVILKPSSLTPLTALEFAQIIHDAKLPEGVVNVVNGSGEKIGRRLCCDARIDMISFTGSNDVGKKILEYASENVKKLALELGGKSPSIILADADMDVAVNSSLCSVFLNQGQMCTAMSRILVDEKIYDRFISDFTAKARQIKLGPGSDFETQMGPLISAQQRQKVLGYIKQAQSEGAKVLCGGKIPADERLKNGFFFEPAVITGVKPDMQVFQEEIFGPVACVSEFSSLDEAIRMANDSRFGLAASIWTKDASKAEGIAAQLNAGTVWINTYGMFYNAACYGGFKQSGFGKELGKEGFLEYTRLKNIVIDQSMGAKPLVNYWYGF